jgi:hypothetical protein
VVRSGCSAVKATTATPCGSKSRIAAVRLSFPARPTEKIQRTVDKAVALRSRAELEKLSPQEAPTWDLSRPTCDEFHIVERPGANATGGDTVRGRAKDPPRPGTLLQALTQTGVR